MEKGEAIFLCVLLAGLFMFIFNSEITGRGTLVGVNHRPYCESACIGNLYINQQAQDSKEFYTINMHQYFAVNTGSVVEVFKFDSVFWTNDYVFLKFQKIFSTADENVKVNCGSYEYVEVAADRNPVKVVPMHPENSLVYEFVLPVGESSVRGRFLHSKLVGGKEAHKLLVDLDNDGVLGGKVNLELLRPHDVCYNADRYS
ncbi:MAG TPA: hypothetical protein VJG30_02870 [Candidatus Nanoarchaeia archaeon]|nr:hypothetical protein [Candidatus Nanoarchaeia archaeon]